MKGMVEFFKLSYCSYRGGKKLHQICSATCIYRTVFELKNILPSMEVQNNNLPAASSTVSSDSFAGSSASGSALVSSSTTSSFLASPLVVTFSTSPLICKKKIFYHYVFPFTLFLRNYSQLIFRCQTHCI